MSNLDDIEPSKARACSKATLKNGDTGPDLDRAWILGGFCVLAMTLCASFVVLSEPIIFNIQMLITHLITVTSLSQTHTCIQHLKDYNFGVKKIPA